MEINKPLSRKQLLSLAICAFGIQFSSSMQMANTSSIYKFLGAASNLLPYFWLAAPLAGMLIQPLVGQISDQTLTRYGRRCPYIFFWGILGFISFIVLPFTASLWVVTAFFWIIDCSINGITESLRALIADITPNTQKANAFSWQTIFAGIGATLAAILPWALDKIHFTTINNNLIPMSLKITFIVGGIILLVCMLWTLYQINEPRLSTFIKQLGHIKQHKPQNLFKIIPNFFSQLYTNIKDMPEVIKKFIPIQFFTWIGMFSMWLYFTLAIAQNLFNLPAHANIIGNPQNLAILQKATLKTDIFFGIYQFISLVFAIFIPLLTSRISAKLIHGIALSIGALSLMCIGLIHNEIGIMLSMIGVGIMWGSIMTLPYAIISAELPVQKTGVYLGIFNITITVPQIIVGLFLGNIFKYLLNSNAADILILAGLSILIAGSILIIRSQTLFSGHFNMIRKVLSIKKISNESLANLLTDKKHKIS